MSSCFPNQANITHLTFNLLLASKSAMEIPSKKRIVVQIWVFLATGSRGGVQDHPGSLAPVRELPGAAGQQAVLSEQLHRLEHIRLDFRGHPSLLVASHPGHSNKVLIGFAMRAQQHRVVRQIIWCLLTLRETAGTLNRIKENLAEVNWTVRAVNHTFSSDISNHHTRIQDLQVHHSCLLANDI